MRIVGGVVAVALLALLAVAVMPLGWLRGPAERAASAAIGQRVTIAGLARENGVSLAPVVRLTGVRIAQPAWAATAGAGDLARFASVRVRLAGVDLLRGRIVPLSVDIAGAEVWLVRDATGRSNWAGAPQRAKGGPPRASPTPRLAHLGIADARVQLVDAKRHVIVIATVAADARGLVVAGRGTQRGQPLTLRVTAAPLDRIDPAARWPFTVDVASPLVMVAGHGTADHALDTRHFTLTLATRGHDLHDLDDLIEAGVPATQPFALTATVRHDDHDWQLDRLAGTIGRSDLTGRLTVRRRNYRSLLDGELSARAFDFDDLASDAQLARGRAEEARIGKRIIPATQIDLTKLGQTDGVLRVHLARLLSNHPSPFVGLTGTLRLDHRVLTLHPVTATLTHGTLAGTITVDHRTGAPKLDVALDLVGGRIEDLFAIDPARARVPVDGRIRLHGAGETVRDALGRGSGTLDVFGSGGGMDDKVATLAAGDVVRGLGLAVAGGEQLAPIRCLDARFVAHDGVLTARDLLLDTSVMRAAGDGTVTLPAETLRLTLHGRSKHPDIVQSTVPITIGGTLAKATFDVVPVDRSPPKRTLLGRIGEVVRSLKTKGDAGRAEVAPDAPCATLRSAALGSDWDRRHGR